MPGIVWQTYVSQVAISAPSSMAICVAGSSRKACWIWPNRVQSSAKESTPAARNRQAAAQHPCTVLDGPAAVRISNATQCRPAAVVRNHRTIS